MQVPASLLDIFVDYRILRVHHIHCLVELHEALQIAYEGSPRAHDIWENCHWPHCLDYVHRASNVLNKLFCRRLHVGKQES